VRWWERMEKEQHVGGSSDHSGLEQGNVSASFRLGQWMTLSEYRNGVYERFSGVNE
jgi:hypothetical protein